MGEITLILGGVRSGKSAFALGLAKAQSARAAYIATAPACDDEMKARIKKHKRARPGHWITIEAQGSLARIFKKIPKACDGVLIECIATYVSNLMMNGLGDDEILRDIKGVLAHLKRLNKKIFIVSNEVGSGVVPETRSGRQFRDVIGNCNQVIARDADEVYAIIAGLPVKLK